MKKIARSVLMILMIFSLLVPMNAFADGDGNIDTGGGDMGSGTSTNLWNPGNEGVNYQI